MRIVCDQNPLLSTGLPHVRDCFSGTTNTAIHAYGAHYAYAMQVVEQDVPCCMPQGEIRSPYMGLFAIALFEPRIGMVVIPVAFPEPETIFAHELETTEPFGTLPEIFLGGE
jgi:hypothetical protein